jgi:hypothetical protein
LDQGEKRKSSGDRKGNQGSIGVTITLTLRPEPSGKRHRACGGVQIRRRGRRLLWRALRTQVRRCASSESLHITGSSPVRGVHGRGSAKVDTGIACELHRRADAVRVGQRCTTLDPAI